MYFEGSFDWVCYTSRVQSHKDNQAYHMYMYFCLTKTQFYFSPKNVQHLIKHAKFLILHFNHIAKNGLNDMKYFFLERGKNMF